MDTKDERQGQYVNVDHEHASEEQLRAAIQYNSRAFREISAENAKLKRVVATAKQESSFDEDQEFFEEEVQSSSDESESSSTKDDDFTSEAEYYYSALKEIPEDELEEKIDTALPIKTNHDYEKILLRIKAEIIRSKGDIEFVIAQGDLPKGDLIKLKDDLLLEQRLADLIAKRLKKETMELNTEESQENTLIFVPTSGGNIRILEEIDKIDPEYYERFYGLLQSIKDGTFKNVKRFSGNSELAGLCEVKDFKTRVIFKRLNSNTYAIISAFIKKSDNDKGYRKMLKNHYSNYQSIEDQLIANLQNEEFIKLQKGYEKELFDKISSSKGDGAIKVKDGD